MAWLKKFPNLLSSWLSQLWIIGNRDAVQFKVQANATQTNDILEITDSNGNILIRITGDGKIGVFGTPDESLTVVGNFDVSDSASAATKNYRFRTSGSNLDLDAAGKDLYISCYTLANFGGTQRQYIQLGAQFEFEKHLKKTIWDNAGSDMIVFDKDAATYKADFATSVRMDGLRLDQTPTAGTFTPTHYVTVNMNGTDYRIPIAV